MQTTKQILQNLPQMLKESTSTDGPINWQQHAQRAKFETLGDPQLEAMAEGAAKWCDRISQEKWCWLSIVGRTGVGKTHLARHALRTAAVCIPDASNPHGRYNPLNKWEELLQPTMFIDWRKTCDQMRAGDWWRIEDACDAFCVVLDDIGAEYDPSGMLASKLDRVLNSRLGIPTIITSNCMMDEIPAQLGTRIASRIIRNNGIVVECNAQDFFTR